MDRGARPRCFIARDTERAPAAFLIGPELTNTERCAKQAVEAGLPCRNTRLRRGSVAAEAPKTLKPSAKQRLEQDA